MKEWATSNEPLDDADSNSLTHVTDSEATKWGVVGEGLDAHRLAGNHFDDSSVTASRNVSRVFEMSAVFEATYS